jgi:hypothetical protein
MLSEETDLQNGEGTSPDYNPNNNWPLSAFMAFNVDADETTMTFTIGEEEYVRDIPYVCEDCVVSLGYDLMYPTYDPNPTPTWCTGTARRGNNTGGNFHSIWHR